jgi:hypothetical protein
LLLQHLQGDGEGRRARLPYEQVNMFGHQHVTGDDKSIPQTDPLQFLLEGAIGFIRAQHRESSITTEGEEVEFSGFLMADKTLGHSKP